MKELRITNESPKEKMQKKGKKRPLHVLVHCFVRHIYTEHELYLWIFKVFCKTLEKEKEMAQKLKTTCSYSGFLK